MVIDVSKRFFPQVRTRLVTAHFQRSAWDVVGRVLSLLAAATTFHSVVLLKRHSLIDHRQRQPHMNDSSVANKKQHSFATFSCAFLPCY